MNIVQKLEDTLCCLFLVLVCAILLAFIVGALMLVGMLAYPAIDVVVGVCHG